MASNKIKNDKYYTSPELARYCVEKTKEIIGEENIAEWIEPSGGNGVFLDYLPKGTYSCDIEPEDDRIEKQDYLELDLEYKEGRCIIGNPPFGNRNTLSVKFYKKSIQLSDYIAFILPISQLNNNMQMYEFDLIYSEDLGKREYSDRKVHCCFNIYRRPQNRKFNKKVNYKNSKIIEIREIREVIKDNNPKRNRELRNFEYDFAICAWGSNIGKKCNDGDYAKTFFIKIKENEYFTIDDIKEIILSADWCKLYPMTATPNLLQWQVYKYLKEQIPELE